MTCVGIITNPASGKDIRRLVAHGSVFSNQEKVNMVRRILLGLDAMGVDTVWTMPDAFDICRQAQAPLTLRASVQQLDMPVENFPRKTPRWRRLVCKRSELTAWSLSEATAPTALWQKPACLFLSCRCRPARTMSFPT